MNTLKNTENRGITLISLVITIIILLILAGVSIGMLTGENGLLKMAEKSVKEYNKGVTEEEKEIDKYVAIIAGTAVAEESHIKAGEIVEEGQTQKDNYIDIRGRKATIPAGFKVSTEVTEQFVEDGLVIIDSNGNEFVWIPCEYSKEEAEKNNNKDAVIYNADDENGDNREKDWKDEQWHYNGGTWYDEQPKTVGQPSILKYHGFYVARYEAGVPNNAPFYANKDGDPYYDDKGKVSGSSDIKEDTEKAKDTDKYIPVSQKGQQAWNYISQTNAEKVSKKMVDTAEVKSYLIDSHAWNTVCRTIEKEDSSKDLTNSDKWGNYRDNTTTHYNSLRGLWAGLKWDGERMIGNKVYRVGEIPSDLRPTGSDNISIELSTGMCEEFKAYNIYDLAGNMSEWTTEKGTMPTEDNLNFPPICTEVNNGGENGVARGGNATTGGDDHPAVHANGADLSVRPGFNNGFRVVLYLQ